MLLADGFIEREVHKYLNNNTAYAWGFRLGLPEKSHLAPWMQNFYHINFLKLPVMGVSHTSGDTFNLN